MNPPILGPAAFGRRLVETGDLDPIYLMLRAWLARKPGDVALVELWCLAYWMFYHAGVASRIAQNGPADFWDAVQEAQDNKWPRGTERRHFRGRQSQAAIDALRAAYRSPQDAVAYLSAPAPQAGAPALRFVTVYERAKQWRGFGPWVSFKIADMVDAVLGAEVDFSEAHPFFYREPVLGAHLMLGVRYGSTDPTDVTATAIARLRADLADMSAPHAPQRELRVQEYETVLCKWKSHIGGHYPIGKDTREIRAAMKGWGTWAGLLRDCLPPSPEDSDDGP